jgi:hypothetical protein
MSHQVPVAHTLACKNCGGTVPVTGAPTAFCPYCSQIQRVPIDVLAEVRNYQADAGRLVSRMDVERTERARWELWYDKDGQAKGGCAALALFVGPIVLVYCLCLALAFAHVIDGRTMEALLPFGMIGGWVLGFAVYFTRRLRRNSKATNRGLAITARCSLCGGMLPFEFGIVGRTCPHCGEAVVAAAPVMNQAIGAAQFQLQQVRMSRYRLERNAMSRTYGYSASNIVIYIVVGSFLVPALGGAVVCSIQAASGADDVPLVALLGIWALVMGMVGFLFGVHRFRASRRARFRVMLERAAAQLAGSVHSEFAVWVSWLNTYWNGPYPVQQLFAGPAFHVALGTVDDYPVAIDIDPVPADSEHGKPRTDLLLAACAPEELDSLAIPQDLQVRAISLGFLLQSSSAGLRAAGSQPKALLRGMPDDVALILLAVARLLAECARRMSLGPALPFPQTEE